MKKVNNVLFGLITLVIISCVSQGNQRGNFSFVENPEESYPADFSWNVDSNQSGQATLTVFDQDNPNVIILTHKFNLKGIPRDAKIVKTTEPVASTSNASFELMFIVEKTEENIVNTVADLYKDGKVFGTFVLASQEESKPEVNRGSPPQVAEPPLQGPKKWRGIGRPPKE